MTDDIAAYSFTREGLPGSTLIICLRNQMFPPLNFDSKSCTTKHFLMFFKMDNMIQTERLRYAKICRERRLFHGLINNCSSKSENLKPQGSLSTLPLFCFLFRSSPRNLFSKVVVQNFAKLRGKHRRWIVVLVTGQRSSYLQKLNCQWITESLYPNAATGGDL